MNKPGDFLGQLALTMQELGFTRDVDLEIVVGGSSVYEIDGDGTKWAPVKGTRKYNKDAFIVIRKPIPVAVSYTHLTLPTTSRV